MRSRSVQHDSVYKCARRGTRRPNEKRDGKEWTKWTMVQVTCRLAFWADTSQQTITS